MVSFPVELKFPALMNHFTASFSSVDRMNGVQYMLLTIINTESFREQTWSMIMDIMGIPDVVYENIFKPALEEMMEQDIIEYTDDIELEDEIELTELTSIGEQAFERGVIAENIKNIMGTVAYCPAKSEEKYVKGSSVRNTKADDKEAERFGDVIPDEISIENCLIRNKELFGVNQKDAEIFDVQVPDDERKMVFYTDTLRLALDEITGNYYIQSDNIDSNFIKSYYTVEDLLNNIPKGLTDLPVQSSIKINEWKKASPEWDAVTFCLPSEIDLTNKKMILINSRYCSSEKYMCLDLGDSCDIALIDSSLVGTEISFTDKEMAIDGFEGTVPCRIVIKHKIDKEKIQEYMDKAIDSIDLDSTDNVISAIKIASVTNNEEKITVLLSDYLRNSTDLKDSLLGLKQYSKEKWYRELSPMVEEIITDKGLKMADIQDLLAETGIRITGLTLLKKLSSDDKKQNLAIVDALSPYVYNEMVLLDGVDLKDTTLQLILSSEKTEFLSKYLRPVSSITNALNSLKTTLKIKSPWEYSFDLSEIGGEEGKEICSLISIIRTEEPIVHKYISSSVKYNELKIYLQFFDDIYEFFKPGKNKNDRLFAIELCIELDDILENYNLGETLDDKINKALDKKLITEKDYEILVELRRYRNDCAHRMMIRNITKSDKDRWQATVRKLKTQ